ncbi:hypothetical protein GBAG_1025 [Buttiauxella agrestis ATCC 33320]|uniref:Uncharacterized protein n=1 Tax=Buttiauxella agrestis ATCC 33320 TaxID=1006004 RepID=A0A085GG17_9ENTR|nr:hypothetical protein GBAG_1025 [Buttiauxella agrestis ATCC 33320]
MTLSGMDYLMFINILGARSNYRNKPSQAAVEQLLTVNKPAW